VEITLWYLFEVDVGYTVLKPRTCQAFCQVGLEKNCRLLAQTLRNCVLHVVTLIWFDTSLLYSGSSRQFNMPVILLDRLPLPSLRAYTIISVGLLSCSVYYAVQVTSDPNWKANSTASGSDLDPNENESVESEYPSPASFHHNESVGYHLSQLVTFMIQEPLCIWVSSCNVYGLLECVVDVEQLYNTATTYTPCRIWGSFTERNVNYSFKMPLNWVLFKGSGSNAAILISCIWSPYCKRQ